MDLTNEQYREYLKQVYYQHEQSKKTCFDNFYFSQILWDETMAHSIAEALQKYPDARMVVLAGSGHLQYAWGIPARVQRLTGSTSALILNDSGQGVDKNLADYILFPEPIPASESPKLQVLLKKDKIGVVIEKVMKDGPGQKAGLKEGDIIKTIDNTVIEDIADIKILFLSKEHGGSITIKVQRKQKDGRIQDIVLPATL
jgi:S1-C subfamily serine protease